MEKEICILCEEYSTDTECDNQDNCKINLTVEENKKLRKEISSLKNEMSYMSSPNQIGYRNEMGG